VPGDGTGRCGIVGAAAGAFGRPQPEAEAEVQAVPWPGSTR
jgi:hypothetical protein